MVSEVVPLLFLFPFQKVPRETVFHVELFIEFFARCGIITAGALLYSKNECGKREFLAVSQGIERLLYHRKYPSGTATLIRAIWHAAPSRLARSFYFKR